MNDANTDLTVAEDSVREELSALRMQLLTARVSASHSAGSRSRAGLRKQVARLLSGISNLR